MRPRFSADVFLNAMMGALLVGIAAIGAFGYYAFDHSHELITAALQTGRDLGSANALAHAADAAAHAQVLEAEELAPLSGAEAGGAAPRLETLRRQGAVVRKSLEDAKQLLSRHGLDTRAVEQASSLEASLMQRWLARLQQPAAGEPPRTAAGEKWIDVGPTVQAAVRQHAAGIDERSAAEARNVGILMAFLVVLGIVVALRLRSWILQANGRPLKAAVQVIEQVAAGDLTATAEGMDQRHTRRLARSLDEMTSSLRTLAVEVVRSARMVADTSAQIAQGNLDLSQRTEEQASTLEETASSMEELTSTVANNADNARQASELAVGASEVARKGGDVVGQVVSTMTDISRSSRKIGDIIGVIDGIAFQTNILALNAAVEAARAGEQGRGFAVVASEVRNLAQRSAAAAKEIKVLIGDSVGKVEAGTKLVDAAGRTMGEIVASVEKVSALIAEIAAASQEQSAGIGQVNTAVAQ
ncbi:MAG TPA: methyl-accepting chemotaxis protein, partial [Ramlibacter sp.]|nr:methyl-accepting chemotaxis protein [Ramlibacter sp.]